MNWTSNCRSSDLTLYTPIALIYGDLPGGGGLKFRPTIRSWYISLFNHISPFFMFLNLKINLERHAGRAISIAANCYEKFVIITNFYPLYENTNAPLKITNMSAIIHVLYYDHSRTCYMHVLCSSTTARAYVRTCT